MFFAGDFCGDDLKTSRICTEAGNIAAYWKTRTGGSGTHTHTCTYIFHIKSYHISPPGLNQWCAKFLDAPRLAVKQGQALAEEQASLFMADTWS